MTLCHLKVSHLPEALSALAFFVSFSFATRSAQSKLSRDTARDGNNSLVGWQIGHGVPAVRRCGCFGSQRRCLEDWQAMALLVFRIPLIHTFTLKFTTFA